MKKILFGLVILFIGAQLMTSCSSGNNALSQFSKRKYMKRFKSKDVKYKNEINDREQDVEYAVVEEPVEEQEVLISSIEAQQEETVYSSETVDMISPVEVELNEERQADLESFNEVVMDYSNTHVNRANNLVVDNDSFEHLNSNNMAAASQVNEVVLAILCIFIPPLAVYLNDDAITTNFWVDLVATLLFWIPGVILAFLMVFGGVSF